MAWHNVRGTHGIAVADRECMDEGQVLTTLKAFDSADICSLESTMGWHDIGNIRG